MPFICFLIGYPVQPVWQSGNVSDYAKLLMSHEASLPLYPLLLGCMISLGLLTARPQQFAENRWVRLGIYFGVVLSVEYWCLFVTTWGAPTLFQQFFMGLLGSVIAFAVPWFGGRAIIYGARALFAHSSSGAIAILAIVAGALCLVAWRGLFIVAAVCLFCSTPWAVACYGSAAIWLIRRRKDSRFRYTLAQLLWAVTWLAVNFAAWRTAYLLMLAKYASLSTKPPEDCFVCSAAARGHRRFVRSQTRFAANGAACIVNDQLRTLKAFELLIAAISPAAHALLRRVYNRIGPRLAAAIRHPLAADLAYLALKPLEWFARVVLRLVLGKRTALIARLYRL